jgi:hypothetical protein
VAHVTIRDRQRRLLFEWGNVAANGGSRGNDNDAAARRFEPHYARVRRDDQVQIAEP